MSPANETGWAWFRPAQTAADPSDAEHDDDIATARTFACVFAGPEGEKAAAYLRAITMDRALGPHAPDAMLRHLEGQRQLVVHILGLIERGKHANRGVER